MATLFRVPVLLEVPATTLFDCDDDDIVISVRAELTLSFTEGLFDNTFNGLSAKSVSNSSAVVYLGAMLFR